MEENKIAPHLFDLISSKSFDMLNEDERKLILTEMTEEEYRAMHELQGSAIGVLKQNMVSPTASLKDNLLSAYDKKYKTKTQVAGISALLSIKIPLYQAAAAVLVAVFISTAIYYFKLSAISEQPGMVVKQKADTIFVRTDKKTQTSDTIDSLAINNPLDHYSFVQHKQNEGETGRSIKQDNDLKQFMVASLRRT